MKQKIHSIDLNETKYDYRNWRRIYNLVKAILNHTEMNKISRTRTFHIRSKISNAITKHKRRT